jgi:hypothetical protein
VSVILSDVQTITTRELQRDTRAVRERLLAGEKLSWVLGKKVVGHLLPAAETAEPQPWPDLMDRLRGTYRRPAGRKQPAARLISEDRG